MLVLIQHLGPFHGHGDLIAAQKHVDTKRRMIQGEQADIAVWCAEDKVTLLNTQNVERRVRHEVNGRTEGTGVDGLGRRGGSEQLGEIQLVDLRDATSREDEGGDGAVLGNECDVDGTRDDEEVEIHTRWLS